VAHKFNIGQFVELEPTVLRSSAQGPYEIRHLVPASDRYPGDPCYRIKSIVEKHERVAPESELTLSKSVFPESDNKAVVCISAAFAMNSLARVLSSI